MHVTRYDISDILSGLPEIKPLAAPTTCDLFVTTLGFEDRSPYLVNQFSTAGCLNNSTLILIEYPTNPADNEKNRESFLLAAQSAKKFQVLKYSKSTFVAQLHGVLARCNERSLRSVVFDMSTCSSYVFYPTITALMDLGVELTLLYAEAAVYFPSQDQWQAVANEASLEQTFFCESFENANFQSVGVEDVYGSPLFAEMNPGNRPSAFVAVPNFNAARMNALITRDQELNKTSGDNTFWIIGAPPNPKNKWRIEAVRQTNNLMHVKPSNISFTSTLNYKEMLKELEEIWINTKYNYHLTVGTLGSKMQHVGTYLFMCLHKDVGLLLTEPTLFQSESYSTGVGDTWQLAFGHTTKVKELLSRYMTFEWSF